MKELIQLKVLKERYVIEDFIVEYPIYRKSWSDDADMYYKRISNSKELLVMINFNDNAEIRMCLDSEIRNMGGEKDYLLGLGHHSLTKEEFDKAFAKAKAMMSDFE